jgi:TPP-dependent pyruvate/acetoin dehydrogenase alpha subunit
MKQRLPDKGWQARKRITVCFFGDGAINRGPFLEALNWAQVYQLPVLFVCEDNRWSATTASEPMTAGAGAGPRRERWTLPATQVDGNDVHGGVPAAQTLVAQVRAARGRACCTPDLPRQRPCVGRPGRLPQPGENWRPR